MNAVGLVVFTLWTGAVLAASASLLERALTNLRLPIRWVWIGALVLSVWLPLMAFLSGPPGSEAVTPLTMGSVTASTDSQILIEPKSDQTGALDFLFGWWMDSGQVLASGAELLPKAEVAPHWIGGLWASTSLLVGLVLGASLLLLRRRARRWPERTLLGRTVKISPDTGPATVGFLSPRIVIPHWARALPDHKLELVLRHEAEHVRSRDTLLLGLGLAAVVACPWSPFVWWKMRRLKGAVELDCDRRVLRDGIPPAHYGELLVSLGAARQVRSLAVPTIAGSTSLLERRLTVMKRMQRTTSVPGVLIMACLALVLLVVACSSDALVATQGHSAANAELVAESLLPSDSQSGDVVVAIWVDRNGAVQVNGVDHSLDRLSEALAPLYRREVIASIEAHEAAPYRVISTVQDQLRAAGLLRVVFIAVEADGERRASRDPAIVVEQGLPVVLPDATMPNVGATEAARRNLFAVDPDGEPAASRDPATVVEQGLPVVVPEATMPNVGAMEVAQRNLLYLVVRPEGAVVVRLGATSESQWITRDQVEAVWRHLVASNPNLIGVVQSHPDAEYRYMYEVLGALQRAQATRFALEMIE